MVRPDAFLLDQLELDPQMVLQCLRDQQDDYTQPSYSRTEFYLHLRRTVPEFAALAEQMELDGDDHVTASGPLVDGPAALQIVSAADAMRAFFPAGSADMTTPLGVAFTWWKALQQLEEAPDELKPGSPR